MSSFCNISIGVEIGLLLLVLPVMQLHVLLTQYHILVGHSPILQLLPQYFRSCHIVALVQPVSLIAHFPCQTHSSFAIAPLHLWTSSFIEWS